MKTTPSFSPEVLPAYRGVYVRRGVLNPDRLFYSVFNGEQFEGLWGSPEQAVENMGLLPMPYTPTEWHGLAKPTTEQRDFAVGMVAYACEAVWQQLGGDAHCDTNEEAVEVCLDADRLTTFDHEAEDRIASALIDLMGYDKLLKAVSQVCRLV